MYNEWTIELKAMADRIISMRHQLFEALQARGNGFRVVNANEDMHNPELNCLVALLHLFAGTPGDWSHIIKQIGMFTFTGLNSEQVAFMTREYHIYMTSDG